MSHQPERIEKDCLNCGEIVQGRFCQNCGQENIVTHQNFWSLTKHFVYDIFHFDGKFFDTLRYLLFKPGIVAKEYVSGKRVKYLDPIRMYLFTSALFFLIFFSVNIINIGSNDGDGPVYLSNEDRMEMANEYKEELKKNPNDTALNNKIGLLLDTVRPVKLSQVYIDSGFTVFGRAYHSERQYDSLQQLLPKNERDGWFIRSLTKKSIEANEKYEGDSDLFLKSLLNTFIHRFPYILFISLPFFAGLLMLLYIRQKSFYYSDHAVFTLYHYIFSFIILLFIIGASALREWLNWSLFGWLMAAMMIAWVIYLYKGLRNFYGQSRGKTIIKFLLLMLIGFFLLFILLAAFFIFTAFQV